MSHVISAKLTRWIRRSMQVKLAWLIWLVLGLAPLVIFGWLGLCMGSGQMTRQVETRLSEILGCPVHIGDLRMAPGIEHYILKNVNIYSAKDDPKGSRLLCTIPRLEIEPFEADPQRYQLTVQGFKWNFQLDTVSAGIQSYLDVYEWAWMAKPKIAKVIANDCRATFYWKDRSDSINGISGWFEFVDKQLLRFELNRGFCKSSFTGELTRHKARYKARMELVTQNLPASDIFLAQWERLAKVFSSRLNGTLLIETDGDQITYTSQGTAELNLQQIYPQSLFGDFQGRFRLELDKIVSRNGRLMQSTGTLRNLEKVVPYEISKESFQNLQSVFVGKVVDLKQDVIKFNQCSIKFDYTPKQLILEGTLDDNQLALAYKSHLKNTKILSIPRTQRSLKSLSIDSIKKILKRTLGFGLLDRKDKD